ncbi:MAG: C25 family cysteine peptidase [Candidatus Cloacimonetes bacterium]|jgi:hypothetical protein|nr:C25 family cysteine peptidase [Candidatus Cloacimonadota bacterium]MDY0172301.1 C25 family cysteine peptidase [Candidatus Cloacimonadaceae bacterium]
MKKLAILLLMGLLCGLAFAAGAPTALTSYKSAFEFQGQDLSGMDISFTLPAFEIKKELSNGQSFHRIELPDAGTLMQDGMPELPVITTTIAIPHQGSVHIEVQSAQQSTMGQFRAYPLQQGNALDSPKAFVQNIDYYNSGGLYPASAVEYSDPMILRDFRVITIQVNPFSYNASANELTVYEHIQLRVSFTNEPGANELPGPVQYISPSFDKIYSAAIQNYSDYRDIMIANTPPRYLIIHGNSTDANFQTAKDKFVLWKRQKGADVDVFSTATGQAGSSSSSIQTFIRNRYNNHATRPDYVIIMGDVGGSFAVPNFSFSGGDTDYPYTHMNTGDTLGDLFIGRISAENISQLLVMLEKIYIYERDINVSTADWLDRMLLVGDTAPSGISVQYISKYIKEMALEINPDYTFTERYGSDFGSFVSSINAAINQGVGFYSFRGYIDYVPPAESALFNSYKLLHAINITCGTNNYGSGTSEMEAFVRYGTVTAPKGAVTGIGMSTAGTHTTFNNVIHGGIFDGIFVHEMRTMGEALLRSRLYINDIFGVSSPDNVNKFAHWCNLMGDPTMEVFTGIPGSFQMNTDVNIPLGLTLLDVAVTDADGLAVEGASVVLSLGDTILSRGYTDVEGNVILVLPETMTAGEAVLTVSSHNFKPLQTAIDIEDIPTLVPAAIIIDDDNQGASSGNGNGIITAGETVEIFFGLKNTGQVAISGISGTVSSESPWINILQGEISYPEIMGEGTGNNLTPIVIAVDPATPHQTMLRLNLHLTDSENLSYALSEFIPVEAAKVLFEELTVLDYGDGILYPDETSNLSITLKNMGQAEVENVYARLYTENDLISVVGNTSFIGSLPLGQSVSSSEVEPFIVWQRPETLPGMVMPMYVRLYNDAGFEQIVHFTLTVGQVFQSDPLGPDDYGYVIYDWTDLAYPEVAEYSWLEIAPQAGGVGGTALPITDVYNSGNEGDQVGAQSLAVVNLPFPFQFYGRMYDQITVCSNGFIAMGVSENAEFRNFRLPGAMGPNPMIAPFWDDLATHSGSGIYTMFDRSNHSFIIEWYNLFNGKNGSSPETFQVILYDQATYSTSLGDGPIKFQYHTFNNVNSQSGNRHGNYSSIGIEDHSGSRGLEYTFNNIYPIAAAPLSSGKALYITNVPIYHEAANLLIAETYLDDPNNVVEPGESVRLGVLLENSGNLVADGITATLSTTSPYVTLENAESEYYPLEAGATGVNRSPFTFEVSQDCPAGHVIPFALRLQSDETVWNRSFSIQVDSSQLHYHSFLISDYEGNFNGVVDPGEAVKLIINLRNSSIVDASEVLVTLDSTVPNLSIANAAQTIPVIAGNQIRQIVFDLDFADVVEENGYLPLHFTATPLSGEPTDVTLHIPYNLPNVEHDFELNSGNFVPETGWAWGDPAQVDAYSGSKVWATNLTGEYPINVQYHLYTPQYVLGSASNLSFMHNYVVEQDYDGVNVSISTNNGNSWTVLSPTGGYNGSSIAGLNSESGWTGNSGGWVNASFDLSAYADQDVKFRFRLGSNGSVTGPGWFIDDFKLIDVNLKTGFVQGTVWLTSTLDPSSANVMSAQRFASNPDNTGNYRLYLPNGTHSVSASLPYHQKSTLNNIHINVNAPVFTAEFTLIYLPAVDSLSVILDEETSILTMLWSPPDPDFAMFPASAYRIYRKFDSGPYTMVLETTETSYLEIIELDGLYKYYVAPVYMGEEGVPMHIRDFLFPFESSNEDEQILPPQTALGRNYPNPFNPTTNISFTLAQSGPASLKIYNAKGQMVRQLTNAEYNAGQHHLVWDGRDTKGRPVSSGLYFYRLQTKDFSQSHKMILMK